MKKFSTLLVIILCILYSVLSFATSYTWNGTTSTAWATNTNWTPNGIPGSGDNVTIVSATNNPVYSTAGTAAVTNLTMTSGSLDLNGYTLNVTGTGTFNGGTISNGKINASGTNTTFAGTIFSCKVTAVTSNLFLNGSVFNDSTYTEQTGSTNNSGTGGNKYNAYTEIVTSGTGNLYMSYASPYKADTSNATVKFTKKSAAYLYASRMGTGHQFNGKVILEATTSSAGNLGIGQSSTVQYNGDIEINNPGGTAVIIGGGSSGNQTLASGKKIIIGSGGFSSGSLALYHFIQLGSTKQTFAITGTSTLNLNANIIFNAPVDIKAGIVNLAETWYKDTARIEATYAGCWGIGKNKFDGPTTLINNNSSTNAGFTIGVSYPDTFNNTLSLINKGASGSTIITARSSSGTYFAKNVTLKCKSSAGYIALGTPASSISTCTLKAGAKIMIDTFDTGSLYLRGLTQLGDTAQSIVLTGSASLYFYPNTVFNAYSYGEAPNIYFNGGTFNNKSKFKKTGGSNNVSTGGAVFNDSTSFIQDGAGYLMLGNSVPDTFNYAASFENKANYTYIGYSSAGNYFGGNLHLINTSGNGFYMTTYGTANYNGNIYVSGSGSGLISFGAGTGANTLASGKTIIEDSGGFTAGSLLLRNFTKNGTTPINLDIGNAAITFSTGNTINGPVTMSAGAIYLNGTTFNGKVDLLKTGATFASSSGGNTYNSTFKMRITDSGRVDLNNSSSVSDVYNDTAQFINELASTSGGVAQNFFVSRYGSGNQFNGPKTIFTNNAGINSGIYISDFGTTVFNSNIEVNNTSSGDGTIGFASYQGTISLASGKTISVGSSGFNKGVLHIRGFVQNGNTAQVITTTGTSQLGFLKPINTPTVRSSFDGAVTITSPRIYLNGAVFNNTVDLTTNGSTSYTCDGGNTFAGNLTLTNSGSGNITLANVTGDDYNGNVSFIKSSSGAILPSYNGTSTYAGNITVTGSASFNFGNGSTGCMSVLDGSTAQTITTASGAGIKFKKLKINKPAAAVILANDISVNDSLIFTDGIITTGSNNVILSDDCKIAGACDSSYVDGKVKKVGNDAFTFPTGKNGHYRMIGITAPGNTTDAFTAEYFEQNSNDTYAHSSRDGSLAELSRNEYWNLARTTGSSTVNVTLSWDTLLTSCTFADKADLKVAAWDGSTWKDKGNGGTTGSIGNGTVVTSSASGVFGAYAVGTTAGFECSPCNDAIVLSSNDSCYNTVIHRDEVWYKFTPDTSVLYVYADILDSLEVNGFSGLKLFKGTCSEIDFVQDVLFPIVPSRLEDLETGEDYMLQYLRDTTATTINTICIHRPEFYNLANDDCEYILNGDFEDFTSSENSCLDFDLAMGWFTNGDSRAADYYNDNFPIICPNATFNPPDPNNGDGHSGLGSDAAQFREYVWTGVHISQIFCAYEVCFYAKINRNDGNAPLDLGFKMISGVQLFDPSDFDQAIAAINNGTDSPNYTETYSTTNNEYVQICGNWVSTGTGTHALSIGAFNVPDDIQPFYVFIDDVSMKQTIYTSGDINTYAYCVDEPETINLWVQYGHDYTWYYNGNIIATGAGSGTNGYHSINVSPTTVGDHVYTVTGYACDNCELITKEIIISVYPIPNPDITGDQICGGVEVELTAENTVGTTPYTYLWTPNGETTEAITTDGPATYGVTVTDAHGCVGNDSRVIADLPAPVLSVDVTNVTCNGDNNGAATITVTGSSGSPYSFAWSPNTSNTTNTATGLSPGSYTVEVTGTNGCSDVIEFDIEEPEALEVVCLPFNNTLDCYGDNNGTSFADVSGGTAPYTYLWSNSQTTATATGLSAGSYTVTVTDGHGCEADDGTTIHQPTEIQIVITSTPDICDGPDGQLITTVSGGAGGYSYSWSPSTGLITDFAANPLVDLGNNGSNTDYTLTVTDDDGCEAEYLNYTLEYIPCCTADDPADETHTGDESDPTWGNTMTGDGVSGTIEFAINGQFTVNENFTLNNCDVLMGTDAEIVIAAGKTLTLTSGTHLRACEQMWERIYVPDGATLVVEDGSIIEDAKTAIDVENGEYTIDESYLNKNYVHLRIRNNSDPLLYVDLGNITDSYFTCQQAWNNTTPSLLLYPHDAGRTHIGIDVGTKLDFDAGTSTHTNYFDNADYGILADRRSKLSITDNTFTNLDFGIHSDGDLDVSITENDFATIKWCAIRLWNENGDDVVTIPVEKVVIDDNTFNDDYAHTQMFAAIATLNCMGAKMEITNNDIFLDQNSDNTSQGIIVWETSDYQPSELKITGNRIHDAWNGIALVNVNGVININDSPPTGSVYVGDNTDITHNKTLDGPQAGILLQNCRGVLVVNNDVSNPTQTVNEVETGIRQEMGNTNLLFCNTTHDIGRGIYFTGDVRPYEALVMNMMDNNQTGLFIREGKIGQQGNLGNPWDNQWGTTGTWSSSYPNIMTSGPTAVGGESPFIVRQTGATYYPSFLQNEDGASLIPNPITTNSTWQGDACPYFEPPQFMLSPENRSIQIMEMLKDTADLQNAIDSAQSWNSRWGLYNYLSFDEDAVAENDSIQDFIDSCFASNMGVLKRAMSHLNYYLFSPENNFGSKKAANIDLHYLDTLQNMTAANVSEQHLIDILSIIFTNSTDSIWGISGSDADDIREIAQLCPYSDGLGVYVARALIIYADSIPDQYMNECEGSGSGKWEGGYSNPQAADNSNTPIYKIYPNPNNGNMILEYRLTEKEKGELRIYDLLGNCIFTEGLSYNGNKININLTNVSSGIYLIKVETNGNVKLAEKISIMKE